MNPILNPPAMELELKLEADAADLDRLESIAVLAGRELVGREQVSTYFDTPGQALRSAGLSLRVRGVGERYVQTVKAESATAAGLFARPEWEREVPGAEPVLDDAASPLATLVDGATLHALEPAFVSRVTRRAATIEHEGAAIEVVLDRGEIVAGDRSTPVAEIELELKRGAPAALFSLARMLHREVPLRLGVLTKSERGYRLLAERPDRAVKSEQGMLAGEMTAAHAFALVTAACVRQFRLNEAILVRTRSAESLHQARVALRRLRSALSIFKPVVADDRFDPLRGELRWLAALLGEARDIDVLLARGFEDERLHAARDAAYAAVLAALRSGRVSGLMLDLTEWAAVGSWRDRSGSGAGAHPDRAADRFAADVLDRLRRRVKRRGRDLAGLDDEERHQVRIAAKKLRYGAEFFSGLFTGKKAKRRTRPFLSALQALQEQLGDLNDIAAEPLVLARLGVPTRSRLADVDRATLLARAESTHDLFADTKRFWS